MYTCHVIVIIRIDKTTKNVKDIDKENIKISSIEVEWRGKGDREDEEET